MATGNKLRCRLSAAEPGQLAQGGTPKTGPGHQHRAGEGKMCPQGLGMGHGQMRATGGASAAGWLTRGTWGGKS